MNDSFTDSDRGVLGLPGAWAMGVGGMIGGGIFSTLGVVISVAGKWAAVSFVIGGLIALATGYCLAALTVDADKPGGIYRFLRDRDELLAAKLSAWVLLLGYTLTIAVYGWTFGSYVANVLGGPGWLPQAIAIAAIIVLAGVNLRSTGEAAALEIAIVVGKLVILAALAALGLWHFDSARLAMQQPVGWFGALIGAASVFMAYEGFELLAYDYDEMKDRKRLIRRVMPLAVVTAMVVYVAIALAVPMLVSTEKVIANGEVALALAGQAIMGTVGLVAVTAAAAMSTGSAINATLFSSARLAREVAEEDELPALLGKVNGRGAPYASVLIIAAGAVLLVMVGGLATLVGAASAVFLAVFGTVDLMAWRGKVGSRAIACAGTLGAFSAIALMALHLFGIA